MSVGASHGSYDLTSLEGMAGELTYENFIYLAFSATFNSNNSSFNTSKVAVMSRCY